MRGRLARLARLVESRPITTRCESCESGREKRPDAATKCSLIACNARWVSPHARPARVPSRGRDNEVRSARPSPALAPWLGRTQKTRNEREQREGHEGAVRRGGVVRRGHQPPAGPRGGSIPSCGLVKGPMRSVCTSVPGGAGPARELPWPAPTPRRRGGFRAFGFRRPAGLPRVPLPRLIANRGATATNSTATSRPAASATPAPAGTLGDRRVPSSPRPDAPIANRDGSRRQGVSPVRLVGHTSQTRDQCWPPAHVIRRSSHWLCQARPAFQRRYDDWPCRHHSRFRRLSVPLRRSAARLGPR